MESRMRKTNRCMARHRGQLLCAGVFVLMVHVAAGRGFADPHNPNTDWFHKSGYGVFVHYLASLQNDAHSIHSLGRQTSWNECVHEFDVQKFADGMAEAGAGYVIFTTHQLTRFMIAPNATYDRLTGYRPGEACATRDLIADLYEALQRKNIPLMLYWTGDGPRNDEKAAAALGWTIPVTTEYMTKWASVVAEYGQRYGEKVAGWWVDGCYAHMGHDEQKLEILTRALKTGNPKRIVALNPGLQDRVRAYSRYGDFTTGEQRRFLDQPISRWIEGQQWHILSFLGCGPRGAKSSWAMPGACCGKQDLADYIHDVNRAGGVVSIDIALFRDGGLDRSQLEVLKELRPRIAAAGMHPPVPPGNLAFRKPARLLSLDGERNLEAKKGKHFAKLGNDGRVETMAVPDGKVAWTYQLNLLELRMVRHVRVTFAEDGFATRFRISLSVDGQTWQPIISVDHHDGQPYTCEFTPTPAQFLRISGLQSDSPDQAGKQVAIAELEVYD